MNKKGLNNKGFSLVELIIVMAIMAVLVGAIAPQYVKYLDKSKVSVDTQWVDGLRQAIEITYIDPTIENPTLAAAESDNKKIPALPADTTTAEYIFWKAVYDIMGATGHDGVVANLELDKSSSVAVTYWVDSATNNVSVKVAGGKYKDSFVIKVD